MRASSKVKFVRIKCGTLGCPLAEQDAWIKFATNESNKKCHSWPGGIEK